MPENLQRPENLFSSPKLWALIALYSTLINSKATYWHNPCSKQQTGRVFIKPHLHQSAYQSSFTGPYREFFHKHTISWKHLSSQFYFAVNHAIDSMLNNLFIFSIKQIYNIQWSQVLVIPFVSKSTWFKVLAYLRFPLFLVKSFSNTPTHTVKHLKMSYRMFQLF